MKTLFNIQSDREIGAVHSLLLEVGKDYCSYAVWHKATQTIDVLQFISFDEKEAAERVADTVNTLRNHSFQSVHVCSAFPQALLVPSKYFNDDCKMLESVYDEPMPVCLHDRIAEWQMVNQYAMPEEIVRHLKNVFGQVDFVHAYTPSIKVYNGYVADHQLMVHFTPQSFRVLLKKDSAIQLAQTYSYTSPLDVVYYLLKICYEFELDQSAVYIILSGLVEKDSALYTEIEQYFINVHFAHPPELKLPENNHPQYFFTSLYNLATCVS